MNLRCWQKMKRFKYNSPESGISKNREYERLKLFQYQEAGIWHPELEALKKMKRL